MKRIKELISTYPALETCTSDILAAFEILYACYQDGGKVLTCGNGGSAADAEHIVGELMKGYLSERSVPEEVRAKLLSSSPEEGNYLATHLQVALPAMSLVSQTSLLTAVANDIAADMIFAQQVYGYGRPGDTLIALSTSGNSVNLIRAMQVARAIGLRTISLTGTKGGILKSISDVCICAPGENTSAVQEQHLPIYHALCAMLEEKFFS